jgi:hypothetical protein
VRLVCPTHKQAAQALKAGQTEHQVAAAPVGAPSAWRLLATASHMPPPNSVVHSESTHKVATMQNNTIHSESTHITHNAQ